MGNRQLHTTEAKFVCPSDVHCVRLRTLPLAVAGELERRHDRGIVCQSDRNSVADVITVAMGQQHMIYFNLLGLCRSHRVPGQKRVDRDPPLLPLHQERRVP
jgi:hypothetical protein